MAVKRGSYRTRSYRLCPCPAGVVRPFSVRFDFGSRAPSGRYIRFTVKYPGVTVPRALVKRIWLFTLTLKLRPSLSVSHAEDMECIL